MTKTKIAGALAGALLAGEAAAAGGQCQPAFIRLEQARLALLVPPAAPDQAPTWHLLGEEPHPLLVATTGITTVFPAEEPGDPLRLAVGEREAIYAYGITLRHLHRKLSCVVVPRETSHWKAIRPPADEEE